MYGNPEKVLEAMQEEAARDARRAIESASAPVLKRHTLSLKPQERERWSAARQAAEALFELPCTSV
jgi:hypothetical protein